MSRGRLRERLDGAGWRAVDAYRAANAEDHNRKRKHEYAVDKLDRTGALPRPYRKSPTPDDRAKQVAEAQQRRRDAMTQADRDAENWNRAERRRAAKKAKDEAEQAAVRSLPTFGIM